MSVLWLRSMRRFLFSSLECGPKVDLIYAWCSGLCSWWRSCDICCKERLSSTCEPMECRLTSVPASYSALSELRICSEDHKPRRQFGDVSRAELCGHLDEWCRWRNNVDWWSDCEKATGIPRSSVLSREEAADRMVIVALDSSIANVLLGVIALTTSNSNDFAQLMCRPFKPSAVHSKRHSSSLGLSKRSLTTLVVFQCFFWR